MARVGRRGAWIFGVLLVGVIGVLVALNIAARRSDEPSTQPTPRAAAPSRANREAPRAVREAPPSERAQTDVEPADVEPAPVEEAAVPGCDHPLIPSSVGAWRRYRWAQTHTNADGQGELRIEARAARELGDGEIELTWRARMTAGPDAEPAEATTSTRCSARSAEEPWFGVVDLATGRTLLRGAGRWRWPAELSNGLAIDGHAAFRLSPYEIEQLGPEFVRSAEVANRRHRVVGREEIDVPAGHFSAWRVDYEEERALGGHVRQGTGTLWIAPGPGLVRSRAVTARGGVETIELIAQGTE
jgi:hypothetical protein